MAHKAAADFEKADCNFEKSVGKILKRTITA